MDDQMRTTLSMIGHTQALQELLLADITERLALAADPGAATESLFRRARLRLEAEDRTLPAPEGQTPEQRRDQFRLDQASAYLAMLHSAVIRQVGDQAIDPD